MNFGTTTLVDVLSPSVALGGGLMAMIPWLHRDRTWARALFVGIAAALMWRYMLWRLFYTLPPLGLTADFIVGIVFAYSARLTSPSAMLRVWRLQCVRFVPPSP